MPKMYLGDQQLYFPSEGSHTEDFYALKKIHRPRPGLNPRTSDPVASLITTGPPESTLILLNMDKPNIRVRVKWEGVITFQIFVDKTPIEGSYRLWIRTLDKSTQVDLPEPVASRMSGPPPEETQDRTPRTHTQSQDIE